MSGRQTIVACLVAIAVAGAMFFVGRAGGSKEKTTHVRSKQEGRSVVVVGQKSPSVATISGGTSLASLVSPPQQPSSTPSGGTSGGSSGSGGSTGGTTIIGGG